MARPNLIGIAGGTGAGKSTLAFALVNKYPNKLTIFHVDDYQKEERDVPILKGMPNWDHPDAIDFKRLLTDLQRLKAGKVIIVQTKNEQFNPNYEDVGRLPMKIEPKPIILVEGYLALSNPSLRSLLDYKIFLHLDSDVRLSRRSKFIDPKHELYDEKILIPMHKQYVEPTKKYANTIIDVAKYTKEQMLTKTEELLSPFLK